MEKEKVNFFEKLVNALTITFKSLWILIRYMWCLLFNKGYITTIVHQNGSCNQFYSDVDFKNWESQNQNWDKTNSKIEYDNISRIKADYRNIKSEILPSFIRVILIIVICLFIDNLKGISVLFSTN